MTVTPGVSASPLLLVALRAYHRDALRRMATAAGLGDSTQKDSLVEALARHLSSPEAVDRALAALGPEERTVFEAVAALGGYATTPLLLEHLAAAGVDDGARVLGRLTLRGLVLSETAGGQPPPRDLSPGEHLFVPALALERAGPVAPDLPAAFDAPPTDAVVQPAPEGALLRDCYFYWSAVRDAPPALTARGLVTKRDLVRLNAALAAPEPLEGISTEERAGRLYFLRQVLEVRGLLHQEGPLLRAVETDLFRRPAGERALTLFMAWQEGVWWNELSRIEDLRLSVPRTYQPYLLHQVKMARAFALRLLRAFAPGRWYTVAQLDERARLAKADFLIGRQAPPFWGGHGGQAAGEYAYTLQWAVPPGSSWDALEGRFLRAVLGEPLFWMGCCDLAVQDGQPLAFRITPGGHALLLGQAGAEGAEQEAEDAGGRVIVQPNFDILVYEPISPAILADLDRFATRQSAGNVLQYHVSRASLYRAQLQGAEAAAVITLLEQVSGRELPQNVRYSLLDWQRQHERITIHDGMALCQVADPALLEELAAGPAGATLGLTRLAPDAALLAPAVLDTLRRALEERGYLPRVLASAVEDEGAGSLALSAKGKITVRAPLLTLAVRGELERVAEVVKAGRDYVLTPESLRRAVGGGLPITAIADWLESHSGAPVPSALLVTMKSWSGHYGRVRLERPILVRLESAAILAELLAEAEVGALLTPLAEAAGLATVAKEDLKALRAALAARGITVEGPPPA